MKENIDIANLRRLYLDDLSDLHTDDLTNQHVVILRGKHEQGLYRPSQIRWQMPVTMQTLGEKWSSDKRRRLHKAIRQSADLGIQFHWEEDLSDASFFSFLEVYQRVIAKMPYGVSHLAPTWLEQKRQKSQSWSGIFATQNNDFLGGALVQHRPGYLSLAYVAHKDIPTSQLSLGLSALFLNEVYRRSYERGDTLLGYGKDTNFYGHHLSLSLLKYKRWLGFETRLLESNVSQKETLWVLGLPDHIQSIGLFTFVDDTEELGLRLFSDEAMHLPEYQPINIRHTQVASLSDLQRTHRTFLKSLC